MVRFQLASIAHGVTRLPLRAINRVKFKLDQQKHNDGSADALEASKARLREHDPEAAFAALHPYLSHRDANNWILIVFAVILRCLPRGYCGFDLDVTEASLALSLANDPEGDAKCFVYLQLSQEIGVEAAPAIVDVYVAKHPNTSFGRDVRPVTFVGETVEQTVGPTTTCRVIEDDAELFEEQPGQSGDRLVRGPVVLGGAETKHFSVLNNVKLYMLPGLHGLVEIAPDQLLGGQQRGYVHPHRGTIFQFRGAELVKIPTHTDITSRKVIALPGRHVLPFRAATTWYYHFVIEVLQAIWDFRTLDLAHASIIAPKSKTFYDRFSPSTVHHMFNALNVSAKELEWLDDGIYEIEELLVPTDREMGNLAFVERLLNYALSLGDQTRWADYRYIYIARRPELGRALLNENEIIEKANRLGVPLRAVWLEDMDFIDQVQLFNAADLIIAPHGGGLTNIIFCRPGTAVIEFHHQATPMMYRILAAFCKLRYLAYFPNATGTAEGADFTVDPDKLLSAIDLVCKRT